MAEIRRGHYTDRDNFVNCVIGAPLKKLARLYGVNISYETRMAIMAKLRSLGVDDVSLMACEKSAESATADRNAFFKAQAERAANEREMVKRLLYGEGKSPETQPIWNVTDLNTAKLTTGGRS